MGEKNSPLFELGTRRFGLTLARVAAPSFSSETSPAGAAVYTVVPRFLRLPRMRRLFSEEWARAARRTERFTDHATIPRQASTARPIKPRMAPTAMKTVPSGVFDVCMYGAFAVGGMVTTAPPVDVEDEDVDVVVVETVVVVVSEEVEVDVADVVVVDVVVDIVVVDIVDVVDVEDVDVEDVVVEVVLSEVVVEVLSLEVVLSVTLGVLSVVEGSAVVWASVVVSAAGTAET